MTRPRPVRSVPVAVCAVFLVFLAVTPAFPSGFQIMTHDAKAMGMGLAFAAVADDPSAVFYNPAGLGWQKNYEVEVGASIITKVKGDFNGAAPYPGVGNVEKEHETTYVLPTIYINAPLTSQLNFGLGLFAPYGLGFRWDNPDQFSGRFIGQNTVIQSYDINPVFSYQIIPQLTIAAGADVRFSGVQLEKNQGAVNPFTNSAVDVAHIKLKSDLTDNHGWGWNAGILVKPIPELSIGAAYRSHIKIDYEGTSTFQQRPTGNAQFDAIVASQLPKGSHPVTTTVDFPESVNLGAAVFLPAQWTISLEGDWTRWERYKTLDILFPDLVGHDLHRQNNWKDSWAYRVGLEKKINCWAIRAGYYRDNTPQPVVNAGPIFADNDRNAYTLGFGYYNGAWGFDISDLYLDFKKLNGTQQSQDNFFGTYREAANIFAFSVRFSF